MKIHELKLWPEYFNAVLKGDKTFEMRKNDRDFKLGDILVLKYFDPDYDSKIIKGGTFYNIPNDPEITCRVKYIMYGPSYGLEDGYCCMGIKLI